MKTSDTIKKSPWSDPQPEEGHVYLTTKGRNLEVKRLEPERTEKCPTCGHDAKVAPRVTARVTGEGRIGTPVILSPAQWADLVASKVS